ncbi:hypothetical protein BGZ83_008257 [Gryganskiella cystojenkinii]|nr:hypothetical protein BGZ83_008257 [Gryganskiella cystojenkinii]
MSYPHLIGYEKEAEEFNELDHPKMGQAVRKSRGKARALDTKYLNDWRAIMLADDLQKRSSRWYNVISKGAFFGKIGLEETIKQAVPVTIEDDYLMQLETAMIPPGLYDVVLCISFDGLDLESVKSLHVMFSIDMFKSETVLSNKDVAAITKKDFALLRLHRQLEVNPIVDAFFTLAMESSKPGSLVLHYIELQANSDLFGREDHVLVGAGKPLQTIHVRHKNEEKPSLELPVKIQQYAVAASGSHVATLSYTAKHAHVDLWTLPHKNAACTFARPNLTPCAQITIPWVLDKAASENLGVSTMQDLGISLSMKASQIAVFSTQVAESTLPFSLFDYNNNASVAVAIINPTDHSTTQQLEPSTRIRGGIGYEGLVDFIGYGKFHDTAVGEQDEKNERFIVCDGLSVIVYSTFGTWEHIYTIKFKIERRPGQDRVMINSVRSKYFAWLGHKNALSIWDIDSGTFLSYLDLPKSIDGIYDIEFSKDGSTMALAHPFGITTYQTDSGIECKSFLLDLVLEGYINFIQDDSLMMFQAPQQRKDIGPGQYGYILDAHNLVEVQPFHMTVDRGYTFHRTSTGENQLLSCCLGSKLVIIALKDVLVRPTVPVDEECDNICLNDRISPSALGNILEHVTSNGLQFKVQIRPTIRFQGTLDFDLFSVALTVERDGLPQRDLLLIAPAEHDDLSKLHLQFKAAGILKARDQFFLLTDLYIQIWELPKTTDEECELLALWRLQSTSDDHKRDLKHFADFTTCQHQR